MIIVADAVSFKLEKMSIGIEKDQNRPTNLSFQ